MLPIGFNLEHLDIGIRNLVVNINRIPEVYTCTTCEGHIWRDTLAWPTKDGWLHFDVKEGTNSELIPEINRFLEWHPNFELQDWDGQRISKEYLHYTMLAHFESHEDGDLLYRINKKQQSAYFARAEKRLKDNLNGWADLEWVVIEYLKRHVREDYKNLPFMWKEE